MTRVLQKFPERTVVDSGFIVNLSLPEILELIKAITRAKPRVAGKIGLYNLKGSEAVCKAIKVADLHHQSSMWWFWTGEPVIGQDKDSKQKKLGIPQ